jgi:hypothetical protein
MRTQAETRPAQRFSVLEHIQIELWEVAQEQVPALGGIEDPSK